MGRCEEWSVDDEFGEYVWRCNRRTGHMGQHKAYDPNNESLQVDGCFVLAPRSERKFIEWV